MTKKILILDENLLLARLIQSHLEEAGYELLQARNPVEAADAVEKASPEVILMTDSAQKWEVTPKAGAIEGEPRVDAAHPVHVIHMTDQPQGLHKASGAGLVVTRPFSPTYLVDEINRLCCA